MDDQVYELICWLDVCVGMAGLRMQDSGEGDIQQISMPASQIMKMLDIVEI